MNADIDDSHSLLKAFGGQVFWDRVWIGGALCIYCLTLAYIVYRRTGLHYLVSFFGSIPAYGGGDGGDGGGGGGEGGGMGGEEGESVPIGVLDSGHSLPPDEL